MTVGTSMAQTVIVVIISVICVGVNILMKDTFVEKSKFKIG